MIAQIRGSSSSVVGMASPPSPAARCATGLNGAVHGRIGHVPMPAASASQAVPAPRILPRLSRGYLGRTSGATPGVPQLLGACRESFRFRTVAMLSLLPPVAVPVRRIFQPLRKVCPEWAQRNRKTLSRLHAWHVAHGRRGLREGLMTRTRHGAIGTGTRHAWLRWVSWWNISSNRRVMGPGLPVPIGRPSMLLTATISAAVPVRKHSSAA